MALSGDTSQIKYATGSDADDGDYSTALVAAVTGKKIRVLSLVVTALTTAGVVTIKSGGGTTLLAHHLALGTPLVIVGGIGAPVCETVAGESLLPSNAAGVDSFVSCTYVEVTP